MRSVALVSLLALSVLAGCIGTDDTDPKDTIDEIWGEAIRPILPDDPMPQGGDHDHGDPSQHRLLWNYDFAHRDPMQQNEVQTAGLHALKTAGDHLFGAAYGSHVVSASGGLYIWDISDPAQPQQTAHLPIPGHVGGDRSLGVTPDGDFAVLGAEPVTCFGHVNPVPVNAYLIDTRDKSDPMIVDVMSLAGPSLGGLDNVNPRQGIHAVWVQHIDGEDYAFIWGDVYRIDRDGPTGASLIPTGAYVPVGHDMYVRETPWGDHWGLAATGSNFRVYDLTDPTQPEMIAIWDEGDGHYIHTADVTFFDDGQIIMVLTSEDWADHESPFWVFDATALRDHGGGDPYELEDVHQWTNPSNRTAVNMHFSQHNPRFHDDGLLTLSHYHGGLIQFDFRHPDFRMHPAEIAYAVYADDGPPLLMDPVQNAVESNLCGLGLGLDTPMYMDVEVGPGGVLYAADVMMGLYTFTPTADHPVFGVQTE